MHEFALEMMDITKVFPGVKALDKVNFNVKKGEVHALVGENGAGKSTLMKILDGVYSSYDGEIRINGEKVLLRDTNDAKKNGISLIFQEFNLIPSLSVAENIYLGRLESNKLGVLNWKRIKESAADLFQALGFNISADAIVENLSIAEKQMVEIAKALSINARIIIMDEPTAALTQSEILKLFKIIRELKCKGVTIIYISHRLEEIFEITDTTTVLRDGQIIDTVKTCNTSKAEIIEKMVGRSIDREFPVCQKEIGETILEVKDLIRKDVLKEINFNLRAGEILGISGLVGSGRTELARTIFGADAVDSGELKIKNKVVRIYSTLQGKKNSVALVPEDRKDQGLVVNFSVLLNMTICNLKKVTFKNLILNKRKEKLVCGEYIKKLGVKTPSMQQKCINLSGGNQQKIVLAKWLFADADILILDEPTRGIDVGAKFEIYLLMHEMVKTGKSIIMISSELPEVIGMSDRILVMSEGKVKGCFEKKDINPELIMKAAIG